MTDGRGRTRLGLAYGYAEVTATPGAVAARRGVLAVVVALRFAVGAFAIR